MRTALATAMAMLMVVSFLALVPAGEDDAASRDVYHGQTFTENNRTYYVIGDASHKRYTDADFPGDKDVDIYIIGSSIGDRAFEGCTRLNYVVLDDSVRTIGKYAFKDSSVYFLEGPRVTAIGDYAFQGSGLWRIWAGSELTSIGTGAFMGTDRLEDVVTWNTSVTQIGKDTFRDSGIDFIDLWNVTSIDPTAFTGSDLKFQLVRSEGSPHANGVSKIICPDSVSERGFGEIGCSSTGSFQIRMSGDAEKVNIVRTDGTSVDVRVHGTFPVYNDFELEIGNDYYLGKDVRVLLPGEGEPIVMDGSGAVTLPALDGMGDLQFLGWLIYGEGEPVLQIGADDLAGLGSTITLTPKYGTATVTFDHSSIESLTDTSALAGSMDFTVGDVYPHPGAATGYVFRGWEIDGVGTVQPGDEVTIHRDHTATAVWTSERTFTVQYLGTDGGAIHTETFGYGERTDVMGIVPEVPEGMAFVGWSLTEAGSTVATGTEIVVTSDVTMHPILRDVPKHTVRFVSLGEEVHSVEANEGSDVIVIRGPSAEWKVFLHWVDGTGSEYYYGDALTVSKDTTLTAVFTEVETAVVTYHGSSGAAEERHALGTEITVDRVLVDTEGRVFAGWSTSLGDTEPDYVSGDRITVTADIDLYPVWREHPDSTVTFMDGGTEVGRFTVGHGESFTIPEMGLEREGFEFVGWSPDPSSSEAQHGVGGIFVPDGEAVLHAVWEEVVVHVITFMDGDYRVSFHGVMDGLSFTIPAIELTRDGCRFVGWSLEPGSDDADHSVGHTLSPDGDVTLHAVWTEIVSHTVTFMDGSDVICTREAEDGSLVSTAGVLDGIAGWSSSPEGEAEYAAGAPVMPISDMTLYAVHPEPGTFLLKFMDGGRIVSSVSFRQGDSVVLDPDVHSRDGYRLAGWSADDGGPVTMEPGDSVSPGSDTSVHAVWVKVHTVTFMDGGEKLSEQTVDEGGSVAIVPLQAAGFLGWSLSADSEVDYEAGDSFEPTEDTVLYCVWEGRFTLTLLNGNHVEWTSQFPEGSEAVIPELPLTMAGHTFAGWSDGERDLMPGDGVVMDGDTVLRSVWVPVAEEEGPPATSVQPSEGGTLILPVSEDTGGIGTAEIAAVAAGVLGVLVALLLAVQIRRN